MSSKDISKKGFFIKSIGDIDYVLCLKIERDRVHKKLKLNKEIYAKKVLERFWMMDCWPTTCPITPSASLEVHKGPTLDFPYSQAVESLMYLAMGTRPNQAFSLVLISYFASNPREVHRKEV